jgi:uncharacterized delta-60 repeat protein
VLGWLAAGLMVATFSCREARAMRPLAVATNLAFIGYGVAASLVPVLTLHLLLLPINLWRWAEAWPGKGLSMSNECTRGVLRWALMVLTSALLVGCGGGRGEPDLEPEPLEFIQVHRFVETSGIQADGRHIYAENNNFIGPETCDKPGAYQASVEMGGLPFTLPGHDATAEGEIFSSETGKTFRVRAEAPQGKLGTTQNIGTRTRLGQGQTFRKKADGATLQLVISEVLVELLDQNPQPLSIDDCPRINQPTAMNCSVELRGWREHGDIDIDSEWGNLWTAEDLDIKMAATGDGSGSHVRVRLKRPIVVSVPLDRVPLEGDICVSNKMMAVAFNHRQRESYAAAFYRDPLRVGVVPELIADGLEQRPWNAAAAPAPVQAAPVCAVQPDPLAGTLQFERATFSAMELPGAAARVKVTREGGSSGEVSVQFNTADSTDVAGQDHESVNRAVLFREGEMGGKTVRVPIALEPGIEGAETVELRLSDPRGCAALGALSTAVLTIGDDDAPPPTPTACTVGGTVTGLAGSGLVLEDRAQFVSLHVAPDGSRHGGFNGGQPLQVDWIGAPDRATRVLLQPDGRIVLAGFATTTFTSTTDNTGFAVARLNANGTLDIGFGNSGRAAAEIGSIDFGYAAALQPDGKIVIAGRVSYSRGDESDVGVARFNADGTLDPGFGSAGTCSYDLSTHWDEATAIAVQPDGKLLLAVAYSEAGNFAVGVLRLTTAGERDTSFGTDGFVYRHIGSGDDSPNGIVLQPDGRIVVAGSARNGPNLLPLLLRLVL